MKGGLVNLNRVDSHMSENLQSPNLDDKRIRLERRWRRREIMVDSLKHSRVASATKTALKIRGNTDVLIDKDEHMIDDEADEEWETFLATYTSDDGDEMDEDYSSFLATYNSDIEADCGSNHCGGSNIGSDETDAEYRSFLATYDPGVENDSAGNHSRGGSNIDNDEVDANYISFLATYDPDVENDSAGNHSRGGSNIDNDEVDADYISFLATYDPDVENDSAGNHSRGGSNIDNDEVDADYISFLATYDPEVENDGAGDHSGGSNVDVNIGNNNVGEEIEEGYNGFSNQSASDCISDGVDVDEDGCLLVSDQEFDTPEVQCVVDEDYEQFLNSGWVVDGDFVYGCDKNTINVSNVEDESNSSDSDLIVLESYPNCENTPFVSSKAYDASCFGEEMHPKDNMQTTSFHQSQFRKRLVEYVDRPYDYEEYKSLILEACDRKEKERHLETRRGVIKSYHAVGFTKSYLDLFPDLTKAIALESQEKPRVLFLLRGLFFWLENASHEGQFQPWRDELCLEIMRKM